MWPPGEPRSSTIGRSASSTADCPAAAASALATLSVSAFRAAVSFRSFARSDPFVAANTARSIKTGVRSFLPALMATAGPHRVSMVKPITVSYLQWNGVFIGDPLTDNIADPDGYRFHDVFHFAYSAILHWSPLMRALIKHKRKSKPDYDEAQDSGRAIVVEEGLTAWIFTRAKELNFFEGQDRVSLGMLKTIGEFVTGYEVSQCPLKLWERAILGGYGVFRQIRAAEGGWVIGDRALRTIRYAPLESME
jgi:MazG-like nucleotide pyrophosphohydrolase family protein